MIKCIFSFTQSKSKLGKILSNPNILTSKMENYYQINRFCYSQINKGNSENSDDEISQLHNRIKGIDTPAYNISSKSTKSNHKLSKEEEKSFNLDIYKDVKKYKESKEKVRSQNKKEEGKMLDKIKKLSLAEQVTIRKDENVDKYNLLVQSEREADEMIDNLFKRGMNEKFFKKLDKVYKIVEHDEIDKAEQVAKADNIYDLTIEDKDISDIEAELEKEGVEELFITKFDLNDERNSQINTKENRLTKANLQEKIEKDKTELSIVSTGQIKSVAPSLFIPPPALKNPFEELKQNYAYLLKFHSLPVSKPLKPENKLVLKKEKLPDTKEEVALSVPNQIPAIKIQNYLLNFKIAENQNSHIQTKFWNLNFDNLTRLFEHMYQYLFNKKEYLHPKTNKISTLNVPKDNSEMSKFLVENYTIRKTRDKIVIRLLKNFVCEFERRKFEIICSKIISLNKPQLNIVYNSNKNTKTKEGAAVFLIFVENIHTATLITNAGSVENIQIMNYLSTFLGIVLVELIQNECQNGNNTNLQVRNTLLHFNLICAKKFNVESQLSAFSKIKSKKILMRLIDGKLSRFNHSMPILKFYSYSNIFTKYFRQYFKVALSLAPGDICYKM